MIQTSSRPVLLVMAISGMVPPQTIPLNQDAILIGRAPDNTVVLTDPAISRQHLRLDNRGGVWHVTCLASTRNLFINGRQAIEADLRSGDQLVIGGIALRFSIPGATLPQGQKGTIMAAGAVPLLQVHVGGGGFDVPLREATLTLGRDPTSTVILPSPLVSTHHATLNREPDGRFTIRDLNSANGLYVRGQRVMAHTLNEGDIVQIGESQNPQNVTLTYTSPAFQNSQPSHSAKPGNASSVAGGRIVIPPMQHVTLGRDPQSTVALPNPLVSWNHAVLSRDPAGNVILRDLGSTNGTFVNFQRISTPAALRPGDKVHVGIYDFVFDGNQLTQGTRPGQGMRIDVYDLVRTVRGGKTTLLDHVTLSVQAGDFIAIAGGSGAGKTTLMRALAGIQPAQHGKVFFNGIDAYQNYDVFRGTIGFVPQADIVHAALTVDRALYYTARFRLASDVRPDEIEHRIREVLETVGLTHRRQNVISSLSGGERKRVNLAVELLADPPILFLDEPNAGLDPNLRMGLIQTMRELAAKGRTIILVTHHIEDIQACDRLAFMGSGGRLCYYGPPNEALGFFQVTTYEHLYAKVTTPPEAEQWRGAFMRSPIFAQYVQRALPQTPPPQMLGVMPAHRQGWTPAQNPSVQRLSPTEQWWLLMRRYVEILLRDRVNLGILLLQAPIIGVIMFGIAKQGIFTGGGGDVLFAQRILFFLAICAIWFGTSNSAREISKELDIYQRERLAGLGVIPYIFSKIGVLSVLCLIQTFILQIFVIARTGLPPFEAGVFFGPAVDMYIALLFSGLAALAMGLCVSAAANTPDKALSAVPLVLIPQILLAGIIFTLAGPMQLVGDVTISHWTIQSLGSAVNMNHLYYNKQITGGSLSLLPDSQIPDKLNQSEQDRRDQGNSPYDPTYYGKPTLTADYVHSVRQDLTDPTTWNDAVGDRRAHWFLTNMAMFLLFVVFTGGAIWLQKSKDPS